MLALELEEFSIEVKEGSIKNVGPTNKAATAKLFDVASAEAQAFGDRRVKLVFEDDEGNEVQVSLFPEDVRRIVGDVEAIEDETSIFG